MSPFIIPLAGIVFGCIFVVVIVALGSAHKVSEKRSQLEAEIHQMEMAYRRARESFSR